MPSLRASFVRGDAQILFEARSLMAAPESWELLEATVATVVAVAIAWCCLAACFRVAKRRRSTAWTPPAGIAIARHGH
jgi:hypothetical protein